MEATPRTSKKRAANRNRPKPTACFALLPEQVEQLRDIAQERQVSQSMLVREALDQYLRRIVTEVADTRQRSQPDLPRPAAQAPVDMSRLRVVKADHARHD